MFRSRAPVLVATTLPVRSARKRGFRKVLALSAVCLTLAARALASPIPDLEPGHWYEIPNSRVDAVDPCPADNCAYTAVEGQTAVINDWNGGAYDTVNDRLIVWGGGHSGYAGNELYAFDLNAGTWIRWTEPSTNTSCDFSTNEYPNGSPCAMHTYDYVDFHPGSQSFVILGGASPYPQGGGGSPTAHMYSFASNAWRRGADRTGGSTLEGATSGYDPTRDVFWVLPAYDQKFAKFDPNANGGVGQWTQYNNDNISIDAASAVDPVHDLFVTVDGRGNHTVRVHELANPSAAPVVVTTTGDTAPEQQAAAGFEWDPATNQFVSWIGGTSVYTLTPPAGDWKTGTWTWAQVQAAPTNTVTPTAHNPNGTYSRFRYVPSKNLFIVVNGTNENVFVYKLSAGGAPPPCDGEADWVGRSTASGVVYANDFRTQAEFDIGVFPDSRVLNVTWDPTRSITGGHSIRFAILKTDSENSGNWRTYLRPNGVAFADGDEFYVQYRLYIPAYHLGHTYLGGGGWKTSILSEYYASFTNHEVVLGNNGYRGYPRGYYRGRPSPGQGVDYNLWDKQMGYLGCGLTDPDFVHQPEIDRGPQSGGTTCENNRRRYGGLYSYGTPAYGESALPDPLTGAEVWRADKWQTVLQHVKIGNFDQANSTVETWFAAEGDPYTLLYSKTDAILGALDAGENGYEAIWLTPFDTGKDPDPTRQDTFMNYAQLIVSTQFIAAPGCSGQPQAMAVDAHAVTGSFSNANGVLEPGEIVQVAPSWKNTLAAPQPSTGTASNLTGPSGPTYLINDSSADYGTIGSGAIGDCDSATGDCYRMTVFGPRPSAHWDATFTESLSPSAVSKSWTLHVGDSFPDVPESDLFYTFIENLFHNGVTAGCGVNYCPNDSVTRAQMAVFLLKGKFGASHVPPPATGTIFGDVHVGDFAADWIEELASLQITAGCAGGNYCPNDSVTRAEMAVFLLKSEHGSAYAPPACTGVFADVACSPTPAFAVDWIERLYGEGITGGCAPAPPGGDPGYCPDSPSTRGQMAVFLVKTFGLLLYGP